MDTIEVKVIVNQRRQTRWLKDYHESYRKSRRRERMQSFPKQKKKKRSKKKEPERPSIMHSKESGTCYLCMKLHNDYRRHPALQEHHIFGGCPNRTHSGHYGLKVYLCNVHHLAGTGPEAVHSNQKVMDMLHEEGQRAFEDRFGSREEFMKIFGKNFIMEEHKHDGH